MKIKTTRQFYDTEAGTLRKVGDTFNATVKRFKHLNNTIHGKLVEEIKTTKTITKKEIDTNE